MIKINDAIFDELYNDYLIQLEIIGQKYNLPTEIEKYQKDRKQLTKIFIEKILFKSIDLNK